MRKTALVTGGSRNIGRAIAIGLAQAGVDVWVCARNTETLAETLEIMNESGGKHGVIAGDLTANGGVDSVSLNAICIGSHVVVLRA